MFFIELIFTKSVFCLCKSSILGGTYVCIKAEELGQRSQPREIFCHEILNCRFPSTFSTNYNEVSIISKG